MPETAGNMVGRLVHFLDEAGEVMGKLVDFDGEVGWLETEKPIGGTGDSYRYIIADFDLKNCRALGTWRRSRKRAKLS